MEGKFENKKCIRILSKILIFILLFSSCEMCYTSYGATSEQEIGTDVKATFNSTTGELSITSTSSESGTINSLRLDDFFSSIGRGNIRTITFTNKVYMGVWDANFFISLKNLTTINNMSNLDTSKAETFAGMFQNCSSLTSLDLRGLDTSKVKSTFSMFNGCSSLTDLKIGNFNTSNVTEMDYMFKDCSKLTSLDVSSFDTSNVTSMYCMFDNCSKLTSLNVSNFNTSKVTNISAIFAGCNSLKNLDVSNFNTSNVTDMNNMFSRCNSLTNLNLGELNTNRATTMIAMFSGCSSLTNLDVSSFNTSNVTSMYCMFQGCNSLTNLNLSNFNMSKVNDTGNMLSACDSLNDLYTPRIAKTILLPGNYYNATDSSDNNVYTQISKDTFSESVHLKKGIVITYNANGGEGDQYKKIKRTSESLQIDENKFTSNEGRIFASWNTNARGTGTTYNPGDTYTGNEDLILYAQWLSNEYTVTFKDGDTVLSTQKVTSGGSAVAPEIPTKAGYTFTRWDKDFSNVTSDIIVNAEWTASSNTPYTVEQYRQNLTLDDYDFIGSDTYEGTTGETVTIGVTGIEGFFVDENNTMNKLSGVVSANGNLVLKVYYDREVYNVTLNTNGGSITEGEEVTSYTYGVGATLPTPVKEGYIFAGWYKTEDLTGDIVHTIGTEATGDKIYYAKWEEGTGTAYKVEHYKQNPETNAYEKVVTDDLTAKTGLTVTARPKTYEGYHENQTHEDRVASGVVSADGSLVLKLYYDINQYKVTFKNEDTVVKEETVAHGKAAVAPETPTRAGYTFTGWDKDFSNVTSNLTVKAIWTVSTYKVTLETNGGTIAEGQNVTSYTYGVGATLPTPEREGYTFAGWYKTEDLTGDAITTIGTLATGDKEYYAKWNKNQYTVIFKNGDTVVKEETVAHGANATAPQAPTKEGYTFAGWDKDYTNVTSNIEVNAKWTKKQEEAKQVGYKVEHYKQNIKTNTYEKVAIEELTGITGNNVTAVAKVYEGYHENTSHGDRVATGVVAEDGSLVLKLYYDINQYKVIFKDGDKVVKEETVRHGESVTPPTITKPGYILSWDKGTDNITGDTTFTAVWTKDPNYVDPNANDGKEEKPSFIPQTGESYIVVGMISVVMSVAVLIYLKYRKISNM